MRELQEKCSDCGAAIGEQRLDGCDVERCPDCGGQLISCDCGSELNPADRIKWTGIWPGVVECQEFGWYSKMVAGKGWVRCDKEDINATEDLNRLYIEGKWDKGKQRFILGRQLSKVT